MRNQFQNKNISVRQATPDNSYDWIWELLKQLVSYLFKSH